MSVGYLQTMAKVETMREALADLLEHFFDGDEFGDGEPFAQAIYCPSCGSASCDRWAFVRSLLVEGKP